ncbi:hypothetical protein CANINC_002842 [Pichia inconspicua]|uniref:SET domain-containing protein n=1 Tax=Pichia inconspicua TaxID=52247 RepID=A0A4T0X1E5_9ASCO|nr:hypothetical protein CANINC_002842 [[Candida] inconspicua]
MRNTVGVEELLEWFKDRSNRIYFNEDLLQVKKRPVGVGYGVFARRSQNAVPMEQDYEDSNVLVRVHKSMVLSAQTCTISNLLQEENLDKGLYGLILAFIYERELNEQSPWVGYLKSIGYDEDKVKKSKGKSKNKKGVKKEKGSENSIVDVELFDDLDEKYEKCCEFANKASSVIDIPNILKGGKVDEFSKVLKVVADRAFYVDNYIEWGLVPGADLFGVDSRGEGHVKLDTLRDVCSLCGKAECWERDGEEEDDEREDEGEGDDDEELENDDLEEQRQEMEEIDEITMEYVERMEAELAIEKQEELEEEDSDEEEDEDEDEDPLDEFFLDADACCDVVLVRRVVRDREVLMSLDPIV